MKIYKVSYISFEGHNTEIFFCNKAEAEKWIEENKENFDYVFNDIELCHLKSTRKKDIVDFINFHTEKL
jgi:hypothetical protein